MLKHQTSIVIYNLEYVTEANWYIKDVLRRKLVGPKGQVDNSCEPLHVANSSFRQEIGSAITTVL